VANVNGIMTAANTELDDLVGAIVIRRRTFSEYLDAVNFADGNPTADPNQHLPDDTYFVERKITSNNVVVEYELASAMDLEGVKLPGRSIVANYCPWRYRVYAGAGFDYSEVSDCTYTGNLYFTAQDVGTGDPSKDVCSKTLTACKARFGSATLPFGGFPAAKAYKL
jgi:lambda family phage minor tail protein L